MNRWPYSPAAIPSPYSFSGVSSTLSAERAARCMTKP
jgi:hypothetical protein